MIRVTTAALLAAGLLVAPAEASEIPKRENVRTYTMSAARGSGYTDKQLRCLSALIYRESRWKLHADNPTSSAYGLFQLIGLKPGTSLPKQVRLGLKYIKHRYPSGLACEALAHSDRTGWY